MLRAHYGLECKIFPWPFNGRGSRSTPNISIGSGGISFFGHSKTCTCATFFVVPVAHIHISKAWKIASFLASTFLGTLKWWYVSTVPHSSEVTGLVNPAGGGLCHLPHPYPLLYRTLLLHDKPNIWRRVVVHSMVLVLPIAGN